VITIKIIKNVKVPAMVVESYRQATGQRKSKESMEVFHWKESKKEQWLEIMANVDVN